MPLNYAQGCKFWVNYILVSSFKSNSEISRCTHHKNPLNPFTCVWVKNHHAWLMTEVFWSPFSSVMPITKGIEILLYWRIYRDSQNYNYAGESLANASGLDYGKNVGKESVRLQPFYLTYIHYTSKNWKTKWHNKKQNEKSWRQSMDMSQWCYNWFLK